MTDRRPLWDDDVITAVMSVLPEQAKRVVGATDVFRIIAAVEDWHIRKGEENLPLLMAMMNAESTKFRRRAEQAEAAIQRVRDVCDLFQRRYDSSIRHPTDIPAVAIVAVRRALDGDA